MLASRLTTDSVDPLLPHVTPLTAPQRDLPKLTRALRSATSLSQLRDVLYRYTLV